MAFSALLIHYNAIYCWSSVLDSVINNVIFQKPDVAMIMIDRPTEVNDCIIADVSNVTETNFVSRLSLVLELTSDECLDDLAEGRLYLRGLCVAFTESGPKSETFELSGVSSGNFSEVGLKETQGRCAVLGRLTTYVHFSD